MRQKTKNSGLSVTSFEGLLIAFAKQSPALREGVVKLFLHRDPPKAALSVGELVSAIRLAHLANRMANDVPVMHPQDMGFPNRTYPRNWERVRDTLVNVLAASDSNVRLSLSVKRLLTGVGDSLGISNDILERDLLRVEQLLVNRKARSVGRPRGFREVDQRKIASYQLLCECGEVRPDLTIARMTTKGQSDPMDTAGALRQLWTRHRHWGPYCLELYLRKFTAEILRIMRSLK